MNSTRKPFNEARARRRSQYLAFASNEKVEEARAAHTDKRRARQTDTNTAWVTHGGCERAWG